MGVPQIPAPWELWPLHPPAEVSPQSLQELRQHEANVKLLQQQRWDLKELHKKHLQSLLALHKHLAARWDPRTRHPRIWHPLHPKIPAGSPKSPKPKPCSSKSTPAQCSGQKPPEKGVL